MQFGDFLAHGHRRTHKWYQYFPVYERHFARFRNQHITLFEIGVGEGGSVQLWKRHLGPFVRIVGIDVEPMCRQIEEDQIHIRIGSQADAAFLAEVVAEFGNPDIVIDDGSHLMAHINATFDFLFPCVTKNGIYLVEDLHAAYWPDHGGGLHAEGSFIERTKHFVDEMHAEYTGEALPRSALGDRTTSIHFYDSIVLLEVGEYRPKGHLITGDASLFRMDWTPNGAPSAPTSVPTVAAVTPAEAAESSEPAQAQQRETQERTRALEEVKIGAKRQSGARPLALPSPVPDLPPDLVHGALLLPNRAAILPLLPQGGCVVEVGVALGTFSRALLDACHPSRFVAVDTFRLHALPEFWGRPPTEYFGSRTHREWYEAQFAAEIAAERMHLLVGDSATQIETLPDASVDVFYIDADHSLPAVARDLAVAGRKIRPDGWLVVNDYILVDQLGACEPYGVIYATHAFMREHGWAMHYLALQTNMFCDVVLRRADLPRPGGEDRIAALEAANAALRQEVALLRASTSWRVTAPMRAAARLLGRR